MTCSLLCYLLISSRCCLWPRAATPADGGCYQSSSQDPEAAHDSLCNSPAAANQFVICSSTATASDNSNVNKHGMCNVVLMQCWESLQECKWYSGASLAAVWTSKCNKRVCGLVVCGRLLGSIYGGVVPGPQTRVSQVPPPATQRAILVLTTKVLIHCSSSDQQQIQDDCINAAFQHSDIHTPDQGLHTRGSASAFKALSPRVGCTSGF